jgi:acetamidase/formamidase
MSPAISGSYHVTNDQRQVKWSNKVPPVLTVNSGDLVILDTIDGSNGQITKSSTVDAVKLFDLGLADPIIGPVYIREAEPGDVLEVEFVNLEIADWGWSAIFPGFGLLAEEFTEPVLKIWSLPKGQSHAIFKDGIEIRIRPFLGTVGVAPGRDGEFSTIPPLDTGGNIDCKHIVQGTKLYLPVQVPGAIFSCGDGHAAQGDGEVCGTAIETPLVATVRLSVHKNKKYVNSPHYEVRSSVSSSNIEDKGSYAVLGIDSDLREASRKALRGLIGYLEETKNLSRVEAYMLCSVAANLKIVEAVDMPNYAVSASIPLGIFIK